MNNIIENFYKTTSIRGVTRMTVSKYKTMKFVWLICLSLCAGFLFFQIYSLICKYLSWPVLTRYSETINPSTFPDITICNAYPLAEFEDEIFNYQHYSDYIQKLKHENPADAKWMQKFLTPELGLSSYDNFFRNLFSPTTYIANQPKILKPKKNCTMHIEVQRSYEENLILMEQSHTKIEEIFDLNFYRCTTVSINDGIKIRGLTLMISLFSKDIDQIVYHTVLSNPKSSGLVVSIHPRGSRPTFSNTIFVSPGKSTIFKIRQNIRVRLTTPYSTSCNFSKLIAGESYTKPLCTGIKLQEFVIGNCSCLTPMLSFSRDQFNQYPLCGNFSCDLRNNSLLCKNKSIDNNICYINTLFKFFQNTKQPPVICDEPCEETTYNYEISTVDWPHIAYHLDLYKTFVRPCLNDTQIRSQFLLYEEIYMNSKNLTKEILHNLIKKRTEIQETFFQLNFYLESMKVYKMEDMPIYSWDSLLSQLGGCLSLWMGITMMTFVEVIEFFYDFSLLIWNKYKTDKITSIA